MLELQRTRLVLQSLFTFICVVFVCFGLTGAEAYAKKGDKAASSAAGTSGYKSGFFIKSADGKHKLVIQGRVQARYTYEVVSDGDDQSAFSIERARLVMKGHAFTKDLTYKFQADFGQGAVSLMDFYTDYRFLDGDLHLRIGQYKRPFSRQHITSSGRLALVDRANTDDAFGAGRDIGVMIHNNYTSSPTFEYAVGIFNRPLEERSMFDEVVDGDRDELDVDGDQDMDDAFGSVRRFSNPSLVARVGYNYGGIKGYSEGDLGGSGFRFAIAASTQLNFDGAKGEDSGTASEIDYAMKIGGFSSTGAFYLATEQDGDAFADQTTSAMGVHGQLGFLVADMIQPVLRYAWVDPTGDDNAQHEIGGGIAAYVHKHNVKFQADVSGLRDEAVGGWDASNVRIRSQIQLSF